MSLAPLTNFTDNPPNLNDSFNFTSSLASDVSIENGLSLYVQPIEKDQITLSKNNPSAFCKFFSDWSTIIDLNDCIQGIMRTIAGRFKNNASDSVKNGIEKFSYVSSTSCAILGVTAKGIALKESIFKVKVAFLHGSLQDKLNSLLDLLKSLISFVSASLNVLTSISVAVFKEVLRIPLIILKLFSLTFSLVAGLYRSIKLMLTLRKINALGNDSNDRKKLESVLREFKAVKDAINLENDNIRAAASEQDDIEKYIQKRTNDILSRSYGAQASKLMQVQVDGHVVHDRLLEDLAYLDKQKLQANDMELKAIEQKEALLVQEGLKLVQEIKAAIVQNVIDTIPVLVGSITGIAGALLSVVFAPAVMPITILALNLGSGISFGLLSLKAYWASSRVLKNEKNWMLHIIVKALVDELKQSQDPASFARGYGFITEAIDKDEIACQFKTFIRAKIEEKKLEKQMDFSILHSLKNIKEENVEGEVQLSGLFSKVISKLQDSIVMQDKPADRYAKFLQQLKKKHAFKALLLNTPRNIDRIHRRILAV